MQKISDIESNSSHPSSNEEKGKWTYLCCTAIIIVLFIIIIMAITGEIGSKKN
jgi:uncharacterized integral membrane protein